MNEGGRLSQSHRAISICSGALLFLGSLASFAGRCDVLGVQGFQQPVRPLRLEFSHCHAGALVVEETLSNNKNGNDEKNQYQTGNVLTAKESMFKPPSIDSDLCTWPIFTVEPQDFTFLNGNKINLPAHITSRSFEYGSSWIEHYYQPLIKACREHHRLDIIRALYQWYTAQFTLDYLEEHADISAEQFLYASFQHHDRACIDAAADIDEQIMEQLEGCRSLMAEYTRTMELGLPSDLYAKIKEGTDSFFQSSVEQITGACLEESMSLEEYMRFRAVNAGGMFGFIEQCYLLKWIDSGGGEVASDDIIEVLVDNVGMHIALLNDLYGLERDAETGDLNIILKYANDMKCETGEAVEWAVEWLQRCAVNVYAICEEHPNKIPSKFQVAIGCVSGNHGFHEVSKRYKLPDGFTWPDSCLIDFSLDIEERKYAIF